MWLKGCIAFLLVMRGGELFMQSGVEECFALAENLDMEEFHDGIIEESCDHHLSGKEEPDVMNGLGDEPGD